MCKIISKKSTETIKIKRNGYSYKIKVMDMWKNYVNGGNTPSLTTCPNHIYEIIYFNDVDIEIDNVYYPFKSMERHMISSTNFSDNFIINVLC